MGEVEGFQGVGASWWREGGGSGTPRWKQEVAEAASALATELLRCEGRKKTRGREEVGWASGRSWAGYR